jgi:hypothetical protein
MEMGLTAEFNWYVVIKQSNLALQENQNGNVVDLISLNKVFFDKVYIAQKSGYRIYPMETPLPLIYEGECLGLVTIEKMVHEKGNTILYFTPILVFNHDCPVKLYYENSFNEYKRKQEEINDGGQLDLRHIVNGEHRLRFD